MKFSDQLVPKPRFGKFLLSSETRSNLVEYCESNGITNHTKEDDFHITFMFSKKPIICFLNTWYPGGIIIDPSTYSFDLFPTQNSGKKCLVLKFQSDHCTKVFQQAIDAGASYDYDEYKPHVTLTYDWDENRNVTELKLPKFPIKLIAQVVEDLDLNWESKV